MAPTDLTDLEMQCIVEEDRQRNLADPVLYARNILHVKHLTEDQESILRHLLIPPYRVLVPSGHDTGKTFIAAVASNWWYDAHDPGAVFTLGPRHDSLKDTVWAEVRMQRMRAGLTDSFIGPSAPEMRTSPNHWAKALTAAKDASLTGRHLPNMLFVIEEACGVDPIFWEVVMTMFDPSEGHAMLVIFNPTDTTTQAFIEDSRVTDPDGVRRWHRFRLSALNHPNIKAELAGQPKPIPGAVSVGMVNQWVKDWCEPIAFNDKLATDLEWPPNAGIWYRPGPIMQARALGMWPDSGYGVWSEALWDAACRGGLEYDGPRTLPEIGCDVARFGDDFTEIHQRWGPCSISHEAHNGWSTTRTAGRLKELARELAVKVNALRHRNDEPVKPESIRIKIDDDGVGGGVVDQAGGYKFLAISAASSPRKSTDYPNRRSELWFDVAQRARMGLLDLSRLPRDVLAKLRIQAMAPVWELDSAGRRVVEKKDDTKEKIGRSPDGMDALNLAYAVTTGDSPIISVGKPLVEDRERQEVHLPGRERRKLFGLR